MLLERLPTRPQTAELATLASKLLVWEAILVVTVVAERIKEFGTFGANRGTVNLFAGLTLAALYFLVRRSPVGRRVSLAGLALLLLCLVVGNFPWTGNHLYLGLFLLTLAALFDVEREQEAALLLSGARWVLVVVFFYAGLQKLVHGYYFRGELLAYCVAFYDHFRTVLGPLLPADELARLTAYEPGDGVGPFRFSSPLMIVVSNVSWIFELVAAGALLIPRLRVGTVAASLVFLVITEAMALELFFGALFANTLLLFLPRDTNRRFAPLFALLFAWILLMKIGWIPRIGHS